MKLLPAFLLLLGTLSIFGQSSPAPLATAKGHVFTSADLSPDARQVWDTRSEQLDSVRAQLLDGMVNSKLLALEAKATGKSQEALLNERTAKVADPSEAQITSVYDANRAALAELSEKDARTQIIAFLRNGAEQAEIKKYIDELKTKYKARAGANVKVPGKPADILYTIGTENITRAQFDAESRIRINDIEHEIYEQASTALETAVLDALIDDEAKARSTDASTVIATEVTDKMRTFADGEREQLEADLMKRLFAKYQVKILLKEPAFIVQQIAIDDAATRGPVDAPVKVVMFSDFQCPACSRTDPVLERVIASYGDKVRFVVRNYPLRQLHKNAFAAALAAEAARLQGKFFEFTAILYQHQDALDPDSLKKYAQDVGLNLKQFEIDLSLERTSDKVLRDIADGDKYGVGGTPTIFVNGVKVYRLSADAFRRSIDRALAEKKLVSH